MFLYVTIWLYVGIIAYAWELSQLKEKPDKGIRWIQAAILGPIPLIIKLLKDKPKKGL